MKPFLAIKLRNQILAIDPSLTVSLRNISVNEVKMGCSGFITDPATGHVVYVSTDNNHGLVKKALYRTARDTRDYTGGMNNFAEYDDLAERAVALLKNRKNFKN